MGKSFLEQARQMIVEGKAEPFDLLTQVRVKINDVVVATREVEQAVAQLMVAVRNAH